MRSVLHLTVSGVVLALLVACGSASRRGSSRGAPAGASQPAIDHATGTTRTTIYLLVDRGAAPIGLRRAILKHPPYAREALRVLLRGPSGAERSRGVTTAIPTRTTLLAFSLRSGEAHGYEAIIDLSGLAAASNPLRRFRIITQIVRTLVGVSGIDRVTFRSDGRPWGVFLKSGQVDSGPFNYEALRLWHIGENCPGSETVSCDHFDALP
jgi:spore germination protein GerM